MRHFDDIICETMDNEGNIFKVTKMGESQVTLANSEESEEQNADDKPQVCDFTENTQDNQLSEENRNPGDQVEDPLAEKPSSTQEEAVTEEGQTKTDGEVCEVEKDSIKQDETGEKQDETTEKSEKCSVSMYKQHAPRFFLIHRDGSGTELLRYQDISEYLINAEDDPRTAILMDPLPDYPGVNGLTILTPYTQGISEQWFKQYSQESIIPLGLTSRDLRYMYKKTIECNWSVLFVTSFYYMYMNLSLNMHIFPG